MRGNLSSNVSLYLVSLYIYVRREFWKQSRLETYNVKSEKRSNFYAIDFLHIICILQRKLSKNMDYDYGKKRTKITSKGDPLAKDRRNSSFSHSLSSQYTIKKSFIDVIE